MILQFISLIKNYFKPTQNELQYLPLGLSTCMKSRKTEPLAGVVNPEIRVRASKTMIKFLSRVIHGQLLLAVNNG